MYAIIISAIRLNPLPSARPAGNPSRGTRPNRLLGCLGPFRMQAAATPQKSASPQIVCASMLVQASYMGGDVLGMERASSAEGRLPSTPAMDEYAHMSQRPTRRWSDEEHQKLVGLVNEYGTYRSWTIIAQHLPGRTGKQCRERWLNHMVPNIKKVGRGAACGHKEDQCGRVVGNHLPLPQLRVNASMGAQWLGGAAAVAHPQQRMRRIVCANTAGQLDAGGGAGDHPDAFRAWQSL